MRVFGLGFVTGKLSQYFTKPDGHFKLKVCFNCIVCTLAEKGWVEKKSVKLKITRALPDSCHIFLICIKI